MKQCFFFGLFLFLMAIHTTSPARAQSLQEWRQKYVDVMMQKMTANDPDAATDKQIRDIFKTQAGKMDAAELQEQIKKAQTFSEEDKADAEWNKKEELKSSITKNVWPHYELALQAIGDLIIAINEKASNYEYDFSLKNISSVPESAIPQSMDLNSKLSTIFKQQEDLLGASVDDLKKKLLAKGNDGSRLSYAKIEDFPKKDPILNEEDQMYSQFEVVLKSLKNTLDKLYDELEEAEKYEFSKHYDEAKVQSLKRQIAAEKKKAEDQLSALREEFLNKLKQHIEKIREIFTKSLENF